MKKLREHWPCSAIGLALGVLCILQVQCALALDFVVHAGKLLDGISKQPRSQVSIVISGDRIVSVEPGFVNREGARIIDLGSLTVLPGLIDCHQHIGDRVPIGATDVALLATGLADRMLRMQANAETVLLQGFTSVRVPGAEDGLDVALKRAINSGYAIGPRMWVAGEPIGPTAGHSDGRTAKDLENPEPAANYNVADGPEAVQHAVRMNKLRGADIIKIMPSGGAGSVGDDPHRQLMTNEEIKAAIETAHSLGMKVAGHIMGTEAINNSISLGIDSVEHGSFGDARSYTLYKQHGTYLVPTLGIGERGAELARTRPEIMDPIQVHKRIDLNNFHQSNFTNAYKAGVKIAFGTDLPVDDKETKRYRNLAVEFEFMVRDGMPADEAILTATANAADLIGDSADIGSVQKGRYADLIAVAGDPTQDGGLQVGRALAARGSCSVTTEAGASWPGFAPAYRCRSACGRACTRAGEPQLVGFIRLEDRKIPPTQKISGNKARLERFTASPSASALIAGKIVRVVQTHAQLAVTHMHGTMKDCSASAKRASDTFCPAWITAMQAQFAHEI